MLLKIVLFSVILIVALGFLATVAAQNNNCNCRCVPCVIFPCNPCNCNCNGNGNGTEPAPEVTEKPVEPAPKDTKNCPCFCAPCETWPCPHCPNACCRV